MTQTTKNAHRPRGQAGYVRLSYVVRDAIKLVAAIGGGRRPENIRLIIDLPLRSPPRRSSPEHNLADDHEISRRHLQRKLAPAIAKD